MSTRWKLAPLSLVVALAALGGCRQPDRIDMTRATRQIQTALTEAYDLPVDQVSCPDKVNARTGDKFQCKAQISGQPLTVEASQRNNDGDLKVQANEAVLVMADLRDDLKRTIANELGKENLKAGCGSAKVKVVAPRDSFECTVTNEVSTRTVTVRVRDANGNLTYTLEPEG